MNYSKQHFLYSTPTPIYTTPLNVKLYFVAKHMMKSTWKTHFTANDPKVYVASVSFLVPGKIK